MSKVRWTLALIVGSIAACGAPSAALAPSQRPLTTLAGASVRSITQIAADLLSPLEVRGLTATPLRLVRSESGEVRVRQLLLGPTGSEALRVESALDGSLRLIAQSDVALESAPLSESSAIARALRHLVRLGVAMPPGGPTVRQIAGRTIVVWSREVRGVPVLDDGIRVVLNGAGALVGLAIEESPLAAAPARIAREDAALRAATSLLPSGGSFDAGPELVWVLPRETSGQTDQRVPRRLAWSITGTQRDGSKVAIYLDAGSLALLGWDSAP